MFLNLKLLGTLFLIDAAQYMFEVNEKDEEKRTHMLMALKVFLDSPFQF